MLKARTKEVVASPSWPRSSFDAVSELVKLDVMTLSECQLFEALLVWGRANCKKDDGLRKLLQPLLSQVRFRCMQHTEFAQQVCLGNEVLTAQEKLQIMLCLVLGVDEHVPLGFSKSNINRNQTNRYRPGYGYY